MKDRIRTSLWFAPALAVLSAVVVAVLLVAIDPGNGRGRFAWVLFDGGPQSARELLSTIASSMLTFTALVFSITVLVLQLASNQFSPRVIRTFLQARLTKLTMAMFVGTFVYTMVVLSQVRTEPEFVPALATWCALALVVISVAIFIQYVHHIAHSLRAISVIVTIAGETRRHLDELFARATRASATDEPEPSNPPDQIIAHTGTPGILAALEHDELIELARDADAVIEIVPRIGDFLPTGAPLLRVWNHSIERAAACALIAVEDERTPVQDPGFGFRQLVDIAVRALSAGVNDPTTALQAIDQLHDLLRRLAIRTLPPRAQADDRGRLRLLVQQLEFSDYVDLAFDEIRHYGASAPQIKHALRHALDDCRAIALPSHRYVLTRKLALLDRS